NVMKPSLAKLRTAFLQSQQNKKKYAIVRPETGTFYEDNKAHNVNEPIVETLPKPSTAVQGWSHPDLPTPEPLLKPSLVSSAIVSITKKEATKPAVGNKENSMDINDSAPREQTIKMSALGLREEEDVESPLDPEPTIEVKDAVVKKAVEIKDTLTSRSAELDLEMTSEEKQEKLDGSQYNYPQLEEERKRHKSSDMEATENIYNTAAEDSEGLIRYRKSGKTDNEPFPIMENADSDRSAKKTSNEENKVKEQINSMDELDDLTQSSEIVARYCELPYFSYQKSMFLTERLDMNCKDSPSLSNIQDAVTSYERLKELRNNHCELHSEKIKKMNTQITGLQRDLSETKEMKSQLEHQKLQWERELCNLRFTLRQEKEKRKNTEMFYKRIREQLRTKEEQYCKEVEIKQQLEISLRTLDFELKTVRNHFNQVSDTHEKEKDMLHENYMLQDAIAMLRLEIDTVKNQKQEMEQKCLGDIILVQKKNNRLQKTIKLYEKTLTKTIFQYNGQLNVLTAEKSTLNSQLAKEKQNKERLETEVESYRSKLASAIHDYEQSQMSKNDLELTFQRGRHEWFHFRDKMNFDMSHLKDKNEILTQQLSKAESKLNRLETELHYTRDTLRERTLVLEHIQADESQTQCRKKEIEYKYQHEQGKANERTGKQESLEERLSQLHNENVMLQQQVDDAHGKADNKEKTVINFQEQFQDMIKILQAESEKESHMLEEKNQELINELHHLKERMYQHENDEERESSKCLRLGEENQFLHQRLLSMKEIQKKCGKLENENKKLKQELVNLKSHIKKNMVKYSEVEQYKQEIEERARQEIVEKLKEVNLFLQAQAASQENLQQLREKNNASIRSQMELRIKDLESELSKVKTSQEDSNKMQLETYKQLYLEELKVRMSLESKLNVKNEKLAEISSELLEKQQSRTLLCTDITRPVLEPPGVGSLNHSLISHRNLAPRVNLVTSASTPWTSNNSMDAYFTKVGYITFFPLGFRFLIMFC
ncbi:Ankyrin repeat domain-containing protein 26, partial [Pteropus alecto]